MSHKSSTCIADFLIKFILSQSICSNRLFGNFFGYKQFSKSIRVFLTTILTNAKNVGLSGFRIDLNSPSQFLPDLAKRSPENLRVRPSES